MLYFTPWAINAVVKGAWAIYHDLGYIRRTVYYNSSCVDGDGVEYKAFMYPGTYTLKFIHVTALTYGIVKFTIDGETVATFDTYADPIVMNVIGTQSDIVIATAGVKAIQVIVDGKNPLSSDHYCVMHEFAFYRTA